VGLLSRMQLQERVRDMAEKKVEEIKLGHREAKPIAGNTWAFRWDNDIYFPVKVSLWKRLKLKLFGCTYLCHIKRPGWKTPLAIYLARCKKHQIFYCDYLHGYSQYLTCPLCFEEWRRR